MRRPLLALATAAPLCGIAAAPAAAASMKPKPKAPAGGTVTVTVTNWRDADLIELQAAESGSGSWKKVLGALKAGQWVICDRFVDSTRVYQGALGQVDARLIRGLERVTVGNAMPELTFLLDVPATVGLARAHHRRGGAKADRFESESVAFHEKLRSAYLGLAKTEPGRMVVIDGRAPRNVVAERIWAVVDERLRPRLARIAEEVAP